MSRDRPLATGPRVGPLARRKGSNFPAEVYIRLCKLNRFNEDARYLRLRPQCESHSHEALRPAWSGNKPNEWTSDSRNSTAAFAKPAGAPPAPAGRTRPGRAVTLIGISQISTERP